MYFHHMKNLITRQEINKIYNDVARLIIMKDYIAEFIWYILTGILVINMTTNFILEQNCV